jgi:hypothetical protein
MSFLLKMAQKRCCRLSQTTSSSPRRWIFRAYYKRMHKLQQVTSSLILSSQRRIERCRKIRVEISVKQTTHCPYPIWPIRSSPIRQVPRVYSNFFSCRNSQRLSGAILYSWGLWWKTQSRLSECPRAALCLAVLCRADHCLRIWARQA